MRIQTTHKQPDHFSFNRNPKSTAQPTVHHGKNPRRHWILSLPAESLLHITSYLEPAALFALSQTNKHLNNHLSDDNTWHAAFKCQFFCFRPETDAVVPVLFSRRESTWRREFLSLHTIRRRWERSRSSVVAHTPVNSAVASFHFVDIFGGDYALLSSSLQYGVVSRSNPFSGTVVRGHFDASGTANGLGIGNPNAEFTPNVNVIEMCNIGGTAQIIWGFNNGQVAVTKSSRFMDISRAITRYERCVVTDSHTSSVTSASWGSVSTMFATASSDGSIKLWKAEDLKCIWTFKGGPGACLNVTANLKTGLIIGAMSSGDLVIYQIPEPIQGVSSIASEGEVTTISVPSPNQFSVLSPNHILLDPSSTRLEAALGISYSGGKCVYRFHIDLVKGHWHRDTLPSGSLGLITSLFPFVPPASSRLAAVLVGDVSGHIMVYRWPKLTELDCHDICFTQLDAHDSPVTAIACNSTVLVSGSKRGGLRVWDSLSFTLLKSFPCVSGKTAPGDGKHVKQIWADADSVVACGGSRVMAWKAGPVINAKPKKLPARNANQPKGISSRKGSDQHRMLMDSSEALDELQFEQAISRRQYAREREQLTTLGRLGLSEAEAMDYVLMLSREEARERTWSNPGHIADSVFHDDFDDVSTRTPSLSLSTASSSGSDHSETRARASLIGPRTQTQGRTQPAYIQQAGPSIAHASRSLPANIPASSSVVTPGQFPFRASAAGRSSSYCANTSLNQSGSRNPRSETGCTTTTRVTVNSASPYDHSDMDEDLRLAIELSLAEELSRAAV